MTWIGIGGSIFFTFLEGSKSVYLGALGVNKPASAAHAGH